MDAGCDFAIAAKRNAALGRAYASVPEDAWTPARDMHGAEVAATDYAPEESIVYYFISWMGFPIILYIIDIVESNLPRAASSTFSLGQ